MITNRGRTFAWLMIGAAAAALGVAQAAAEDGAAFDAWVRLQHGVVERGANGGIVAVDLAHSWITDADLGRVAALGRLERLDLSGTRITDLGLELLAPLSGVKSLELRFAEFVSEGGVAHLKGWEDLESLDLRGTQVRSTVFEHLAAMRGLRKLDLSHTRITDEGFDRLAELQGLEELSIGSNRLEGSALDHLKLLPRLRSLSVSGVQRVDSGIWGLALNPDNLLRLGGLTQLDTLDLTGATITDVGSDRPGLPDAERTSLRGLEALTGMKRLRRLSLARQPVTVEGLESLLELGELRSLNLGGCADLGDDVLPLLHRLKGLQRVYLAGTGVSEGSLADFRQDHSAVVVEWRDAEILAERRTAQ